MGKKDTLAATTYVQIIKTVRIFGTEYKAGIKAHIPTAKVARLVELRAVAVIPQKLLPEADDEYLDDPLPRDATGADEDFE